MAISLIPLILTIVLIIYIIRSAALLRLVTSLDSDTLQQAIENAESSNEIAENLRTKILSRLNEIGSDDELQLKLLFQQIDADGSDLLSRTEFQEFLGNALTQFTLSLSLSLSLTHLLTNPLHQLLSYPLTH
jgi:hypothetical protein